MLYDALRPIFGAIFEKKIGQSEKPTGAEKSARSNPARFYIGESARAKNGPELLAACAESRSMGALDLWIVQFCDRQTSEVGR